MKKMEGLCTFHSETGTEGGYWAFQDRRFIFGKHNWSYEGLHIVENGDYLIIYHPTSKEILWSGFIDLKMYGLFSHTIHGWWVHNSSPEGISEEEWFLWFMKEYLAEILKQS